MQARADRGRLRRAALRGALAALVATSLLLIAGTAPASAATFAAERVRLPFPAYDGTLTPYTFALGYPLVTLVYDTLLLRDAAGSPRPWLARSVERTDGGRRLTIRLRDRVRWHDGRPLTAADVAFTFGYVAGREHPRFTPQLRAVERVQATGRLTVRIDLRHPSLGFDDQPLADLPILPKHRWQGLAVGRVAPPGPALGSGPYRLARARTQQGYVLRANRRYFRGAPRVGEIRVPIIGDADRAYEELRRQRVDMVPLSLPGRPSRELGAILGIDLRRGPSYTGTAVVLNLRKAPFRRLAARRALAGALDVRRIAAGVAPATAARTGFLHPESRWSDRLPLRTGADGRSASAPDALDGAAVRVLAPRTDPLRLEAGRQVVRALRRVGARATLVSLARARLERALGAGGAPPRFEAAIQSIPPLVSYDPDYLTQLFGSDPGGAPLNVGGYRSAAFDALARRVAAAPDAAARRRATRAELELLARDVPAVPLFFAQGAFAHRPAVYDGWVFVKGTGILDKRSFVPPEASEAPPRPGDEPDDGTSEPVLGLSLLDAVSLLVLAVVTVLAAAALAARRRRG